MKTSQNYVRDAYNAIIMSKVNPSTRKIMENLMADAQKSAKVDEHGSWEFGADFDKKGRGSAINYDFYAYGVDIHNRRPMIVIQIRQYVKKYKNYPGSVRKNYFLIGRNEDNTTFAHSVESRVIHAAVAAGRDIVKACQDWIFGADYKKVLRQGDLALVPTKKVKGDVVGTQLILENSHELLAAQIVKVGNTIYAYNPELWHIKGTHPSLYEEGWYKVVVGKRAPHWSFAAPTID